MRLLGSWRRKVGEHCHSFAPCGTRIAVRRNRRPLAPAERLDQLPTYECCAAQLKGNSEGPEQFRRQELLAGPMAGHRAQGGRTSFALNTTANKRQSRQAPPVHRNGHACALLPTYKDEPIRRSPSTSQQQSCMVCLPPPDHYSASSVHGMD